MCVPPVDQQASPHFALLADIAARNGLSYAVDGDEFGLRTRDPARRDPCARGIRRSWDTEITGLR